MIAALVLALGAIAPACYPPPVTAPVAVPFVQPACSFCPGHRGVEFHLAAGTPVRAVAPGVVTFSGVVAGTRYLVVLQPDTLRATYGMMAATSLSRGDVVGAGQVVGFSGTRLYLGLRDAAGAAVDPTPLLGRWVGRPRLVPHDGGPARAGPPPHLACSNR